MAFQVGCSSFSSSEQAPRKTDLTSEEQVQEQVNEEDELFYGDKSELDDNTSKETENTENIDDIDEMFFGEEDEDQEVEWSKYIDPSVFIDPVLLLGANPLRLTLQDCVRIALLNNNKVQASEYSIESARQRYEEADARYWPIFEYEWVSAPVPSDVQHAAGKFFEGKVTWWNKINVNVGIPIYAFGKLNLLKNLAIGGIAAARAERKKEKLSTITTVRQLYHGVLLAEELGRLLIKAHNKLSNALNNPDRSPIDKIKAKVFLLELERRLSDARQKELLALEGLRVQLGLNPDVAVMTFSNKLNLIRLNLRPLEDYIAMALKNRPDVKLVEIGVETRRNQYRLEQRKFFPDIGVGAYVDFGRTIHKVTGLTTTDDFTNPFNYSRAGIGMRVKGKFDIHGQTARVRKARSDYYKSSLQHYMAKDGITLEVKQAYMAAKNALYNVERAEQAQIFARQYMFLTQSNSELGVGENDEYTESLKLVLFTRGQYFEAVFNFNVALAILEQKTGIIPTFGK